MRHLNWITLAFASCAVLLLAAGPEVQLGPKLGYIDSGLIVPETPGAQPAREKLQQLSDSLRAESTKMESELQGLVDRLEQQRMTLSPDAITTRQKEIQDKNAIYAQKIQQEFPRILAERERQIMQPVFGRITAVIEEIRKEDNYAFIFDIANSQGTIISADPGLDLTAEVIRRVKEGTPTEPDGS